MHAWVFVLTYKRFVWSRLNGLSYNGIQQGKPAYTLLILLSPLPSMGDFGRSSLLKLHFLYAIPVFGIVFVVSAHARRRYGRFDML